MFSFNTSCLRWKILVAYKGQNGWPGFLAPFATRYLNMLVTITDDPSDLHTSGGAQVGGPVTTTEYVFQIDRLTGRLDAASPVGYEPFPYGMDIQQAMAANPGELWEVSETFYKHTIPRAEAPLLGTAYTIIEVKLSNPYTAAQLDADAAALIATIDLTSLPWNCAQYTAYGEINFPIGPYSPTGNLTTLLSTDIIGFALDSSGPVSMTQLNAAAWTIFTPGSVGADNWFPNGYLKAIGYVALAGKYCEKTFTIDYAQNVLDQKCVSGNGSCAEVFEVLPPPLDEVAPPGYPGKNVYVLITPNCSCGE